MGSESATANKKNLDAASSKAKKKDQDKLRKNHAIILKAENYKINSYLNILLL